MVNIPGTTGNDSLGPGIPGNPDAGTNDTITANAGDDSLYGGNGVDSLLGEAGNDLLFGGAGNDSLFGGADSDLLEGGAGADLLRGGNVGGGGNSGRDTVSYAGSNNAVLVSVNGSGSGGDAAGDTLQNIEDLFGSAYNDTLYGDGSGNILQGDAGDDYLYGRDGADSVYGGSGRDVIFGGTGADTLEGGADDDRVYGGEGADRLLGDTGNDQLFGGADGDSLFGGNNDDLLEGGFGNDTLVGGSGNDAASYASAAGAVTVNLSTGVASGDAGTDTLSQIEDVIGGYGNDNITGDSLSNRLVGGAGNDTISAGNGNDTVEGGLGNDSLQGGNGTDELSFRGATTGVNADLGAGTSSGEGTDSFSGFENLQGSGFNDSLTGNDSANRIGGGDGNDTINAAGGDDTVFGGAGNDTVQAGTGNDLIYGGADTGATGSGAPVTLDFNWSTLPTTPIGGGITQNTDGITVGIDYQAGPSGTSGGVSSATIYRAPGETFSTTSSANIVRNGVTDEPTQINVSFTPQSGFNYDDEVRNVRFRISDIDEATHQDRITVIAYDAAGNRVPVTFTTANPTDLETFGDTVQSTSSGGNSDQADPRGSILITIPGPVARIEIQYDNLGSGNQNVHISDIQFQAIPVVDNDSLAGGNGDDSIFGGIGNDTLVGGDGRDLLSGGSGNDSIDGGAGNDTIDGGTGNDTVVGGGGADNIEGGDGDDSLIYGDGGDSVYGGAGNDFIDDVFGSELTDPSLLYGGDGNDTMYSGDGNGSVFGDAGRDEIYGEDNNDTIVGGTGMDTMYGGQGNDLFLVGGLDVDTVGSVVESIFGDGGAGSADGDFDVLDLQGLYATYGWKRIEITYDTADGENGIVEILDSPGGNVIATISFDNIEDIIRCFTPGTMILTDRGEVAVEALEPGDLVVTRDHGLQPLRWVGRQHLSRARLMAEPELQPVRIAQGALAGDGPSQSLLVSPQHRVLVAAARAELLFGEAEVLVPARHLIGHAEVTRAVPEAGVTYIHILFDRHEIVRSDGIWTESFQPAERMLDAMEDAVRAEILAIFPDLSRDTSAYAGSRLSLKAHEAKVLFAL